MTTTVKDICAAMEAWAPPGYAYTWDRAGLDIGDPNAKVAAVLTCLTVTRRVLDTALKKKADMVVAHHPLIWSPIKKLRTDHPHTRLCLDFVAAGVACYSAHTNLDVAQGGVNHLLAAQIRLRALRPLFPVEQAAQVKLVSFVPQSHLAQVRDAVCEAGAGSIGGYTHCSFSTPGTGTFLPGDETQPFSGRKGHVNEEPEQRFESLVPQARVNAVLKALFKAHPYEEVAYDLVALENKDTGIGLGLRGELARPCALKTFARHVRGALGVKHVRVVQGRKGTVRRVAVLGGSGGDYAARMPRDIDVYVTGDVKYHDACDAVERGLSIIDAGHAGTEKAVAPAMAQYLHRQIKGLRIAVCPEPELFEVVQ